MRGLESATQSSTPLLEELHSKMADWISNGALLAWLVGPYERRAFVYPPNQEPERVTGRKVSGQGPIDGFELNLSPVWKCYED